MHRLFVISAFLFLACDEFDPPSLVKDLRLLAVRAEPAEVAPGTTVTLDTFIANPEAKVMTFSWYACILPQLGSENDQQAGNSGGEGGLSDDPYGGTCRRRLEEGLPYALALGNGPTAQLTIPADLFDTDDALKVGYGFEGEVDATVKQILLGVAGLNYTVELVIDADGRKIEAQKAVNVSLADDMNENPEAPLLHISDDKTPTDAPADPVRVPDRCFPAGALVPIAGHAYDIIPLEVPNPGPEYQVLVIANTGSVPFQIESRTEKSFYGFFATRGHFDGNTVKTGAEGAQNRWSLSKDDAGATDLWIVLRDGRGGISWCHEPLVVGAP